MKSTVSWALLALMLAVALGLGGCDDDGDLAPVTKDNAALAFRGSGSDKEPAV
ncbi:MAG: hypothetical protein KME14_20505 [Tildeniella torsiva UHER 1998/13D]|jgi:hypothetical protein|nr:hypothetical protein [Tildeniella torsiva UHER 1998/13D]